MEVKLQPSPNVTRRSHIMRIESVVGECAIWNFLAMSIVACLLHWQLEQPCYGDEIESSNSVTFTNEETVPQISSESSHHEASPFPNPVRNVPANEMSASYEFDLDVDGQISAEGLTQVGQVTGELAEDKAEVLLWRGPGFVLLVNGNVIDGDMAWEGEQLAIRLDQTGNISVKKDAVVAIRATKLELYQYQVAHTVRWESGEHWHLAKWCIRNHLLAQAEYHYLELKRVAGTHPSFRRMDAEIKSMLLRDPEIIEAMKLLGKTGTEAESAKVDSDVVQSSSQAASNTQIVKSESSSKYPSIPAPAISKIATDRLSQDYFRTNLQPFLTQRCGQTGCHGNSRVSSFHLTPPGRTRTNKNSSAVLESAIQQLTERDVTQTSMWLHSLTAHSTQRKPAVNSQNPVDREFLLKLTRWHASIHRMPVPQSLPVPADDQVVAANLEVPAPPNVTTSAKTTDTKRLLVENKSMLPDVGSGILELEEHIARLEKIERNKKSKSAPRDQDQYAGDAFERAFNEPVEKEQPLRR